MKDITFEHLSDIIIYNGTKFGDISHASIKVNNHSFWINLKINNCKLKFMNPPNCMVKSQSFSNVNWTQWSKSHGFWENMGSS